MSASLVSPFSKYMFVIAFTSASLGYCMRSLITSITLTFPVDATLLGYVLYIIFCGKFLALHDVLLKIEGSNRSTTINSTAVAGVIATTAKEGKYE